jgi:hypothetical protein
MSREKFNVTEAWRGMRKGLEGRGAAPATPRKRGEEAGARKRGAPESPVRRVGPDAPGILKIFRGLLPFISMCQV